MKESVKKAVKTGYGLGLLSIEKARSIANAVSKELKLNEPESRKLAEELVRNSEKVSKDVLKTVEGHLADALDKSGLVKKREFTRASRVLKDRVARKLGRKKESTWSKMKRKVRGR